MEAQNHKLRLGHAELVLLLWMMKIPSLPGRGEKAFGNLTDDRVLASLASADHSL